MAFTEPWIVSLYMEPIPVNNLEVILTLRLALQVVPDLFHA